MCILPWLTNLQKKRKKRKKMVTQDIQNWMPIRTCQSQRGSSRHRNQLWHDAIQIRIKKVTPSWICIDKIIGKKCQCTTLTVGLTILIIYDISLMWLADEDGKQKCPFLWKFFSLSICMFLTCGEINKGVKLVWSVSEENC